MCKEFYSKLQAPKASPEICKAHRAHCISSGGTERWWTMWWKKNKHHRRGGEGEAHGAFLQRKFMLQLPLGDCSERERWEERIMMENESYGRQSRAADKEGRKIELWPKLCGRHGEGRWQAASLLSFKCQRLNLSSFVFGPVKVLSRGLRSHCRYLFNWIRW